VRHEVALALRDHTEDQGRSLRTPLQGEAPNRLKLPEVERAHVVSVEEKAYRYAAYGSRK